MAEEMQQDEGFEQFEGQNGNAEAAENTENPQQTQTEDDDDDEDDRKVFVGGLSWETTTKDLKEYFEKYGEVGNCTLKTDLETRKSRGFGFVVFNNPDSVDKVLEDKEHKLHGRNIDPKKANPRPVNKKVFVGRLDPAISEDDVRSYFENFGPVEKIELPFDKTKDQRRAFCFVEFKKLSAMKKCLERTNHKVGTQEVEVKKATPPGGGAPGNVRGGPRGRGFGPGGRGGGRGGGFQGGYGGYNQGYGGYGGYGGYDQSYGYGGYGGYGGYDQGYGYGGYGGGNWNNGGYGGYSDQGYYGGYDDWGYGQGGGQSNYGKAQKRGAAHGGYHPYNR